MKKIFSRYGIYLIVLLAVLNASAAFAFWPFDQKKKEEQIRIPEIVRPVTIQVNQTAPPRDTKFTTSFAPIVKAVAPCVVSVYTTKNPTANADKPQGGHPLFNDPLFRRFFEDPYDDGNTPPPSRRTQGLGSGVIVSEDGYILTNNHVVDDADEVKVALAKGGKNYLAKVIGTDPKSDLAVLKIDAKGLPAAVFANSDLVEVGDVVLAIGNPFGLSQTVTMGIISALGRDNVGILQDGYEDFIQTDASINPGNSGGALVDAEGRLIGINTAIFSRTGGNQGIGFAVPINFARNIMEQMIKTGHVVRGYMGVSIQPITDELVEALHLSQTSGALVGDVLPDSPAMQAGIKEGDVIVALDDKPVIDPRQLRLTISQTAPGTVIRVTALREDKKMDFKVTLRELPQDNKVVQNEEKKDSVSHNIFNGIEVTDLNAELRQHLNVPEKIQGVFVKDVETNSVAFDVGIRPGDIVMEVDRKPVRAAKDLFEISQKIKSDQVVLRIWRNGARYVVLSLKKKAS